MENGEASASAWRYRNDLRPRDHRVDAADGEVLPVIERADVARSVQETAQHNLVAVVQERIPAPFHGGWFRVGPDQRFTGDKSPALRCERLRVFDGQPQRTTCGLRCAGHFRSQRDFRPVQRGEAVLRGQVGQGACKAEQSCCQEDQGHADTQPREPQTQSARPERYSGQ